MARSTIIRAKNNTNATISAGSIVYISGYDDYTGQPTIYLAHNGDSGRMPAVGVVREDAAPGETDVVVKVSGPVSGFDTTDIAVNTDVYVGQNGGVSFGIEPHTTNDLLLTQQMGTVLTQADYPNGQIQLFPLEIRKKIKHPELIEVEEDQHHNIDHADRHRPTGMDPFIHASQHRVGGGDTLDHGSLDGLGGDHHEQYILVDGSRGFTGTVSGIYPTSSDHLVTKSYVDNTLPWRLPVIDKDRTTPPSFPSNGDRYIVAGGGGVALGSWTGHELEVAEYNSGWGFTTPTSGYAVWVDDEALIYVYTGSVWKTGTTDLAGSGTSGEIAFWSSSTSITSENDLQWDSSLNRLGIGLGASSPLESIHASGAIILGNASNTNDGTIRWTGSDFEGRKSGSWISLSSGGNVLADTHADNRLAVWTSVSNTIEGDENLTWDGSTFNVTGNVYASGAMRADSIWNSTNASAFLIRRSQASNAPYMNFDTDDEIKIYNTPGVSISSGGELDAQQLLTVGGRISLQEQSSAGGNTSGYGQIWVKNDAPNTLWFSDDTGNDYQLGGVGAFGDVFKVGTPVDNQIGVWTGDGTLEGDSNFTWNGAELALNGGTNNSRIEVGGGGSGNRYAFIDLVGDDTYTDYGLRIIRNNTGANTSSYIHHRGTGNLGLQTIDASSYITFEVAGFEKMRVDSGGAQIREGGALELYRSDNNLDIRLQHIDSGLQVKYSSTGIAIASFYGDGSNYRVGIGTTTPGEKLEVDGAIKIGTAVGTADGTIRWSGTDFEGRKGGTWISLTGAGGGGGDVYKVGTPVNNQIGVWTGDGTIEGDTGLTWSGGLLNTTGVIQTQRDDPNNYISIDPQGGTGARNWWIGATRSSSGICDAGQFFIWDETGSALRLTIDSSGNVGIGTDSPEHKLSVFGDNNASRTEIGIDNLDQRLVLGAYYESGVAQYATIQSTNNAESTGINLALQPDGGNVGIGTNSPGTKLAVYGGSANTQISIDCASTSYVPAIYLRQGGTTRAALDCEATTSDFRIYTYDGSWRQVYVIANEGNQHDWKIQGSTKMTLESNGRVGIGTTSPSEMLTVTGNVSIGGDIINDDLSETFQVIRQALDGYVSTTGLDETTFQENKSYWDTSIESITKDLDGYALQSDLLGLNQTSEEHYNQHSEILQYVISSLDGYSSDTGLAQTVEDHKVETGEIVQTILKDLDGYALQSDLLGLTNTTEEHYNQHSEALQTVISSLDGYSSDTGLAQTVEDHKVETGDAIQTILKELDGYSSGDITGTGADKQVTYWTGTTTVSGSNNLYFDYSTGNLGIGTTTTNERLTVNGVMSMAETTEPTSESGYGKIYINSDHDGRAYLKRENGENIDLTAFDIDGGSFTDTFENTRDFDAGTW